MKFELASSVIYIIAILVSTTRAFIINKSHHIHVHKYRSLTPTHLSSCKTSPLCVSSKNTIKKFSSHKPLELQMTQNSSNNDESSSLSSVNDSTTNKPQTDDVKKEKSSSGLFTALILAPPLILKFCIVLIVKFLTDVVVFPLLFAYRMVKITKNKIVGRFSSTSKRGDTAVNGEKTNGAH